MRILIYIYLFIHIYIYIYLFMYLFIQIYLYIYALIYLYKLLNILDIFIYQFIVGDRHVRRRAPLTLRGGGMRTAMWRTVALAETLTPQTRGQVTSRSLCDRKRFGGSERHGGDRRQISA